MKSRSLAGIEDNKATLDRFHAKYLKGGGDCWVWQRFIDKGGYGRFRISPHRYTAAHRAAWALLRGGIPDGMCVLHSCDNPACVNPDHLWLGTQLENIKDRDSKRRQQRGEQHSNAKVTKIDVENIRKIWATRADSNITQKIIGQMYGLAPGTISTILSRGTWND